MRPDKRAVTWALAGVAVAVILGYWAGAIAGLVAALASLFSAAIFQVAMNSQSLDNARQARLAEADAIFAPATLSAPPPSVTNGDLNGAGVARYLRPEAEVVRFWGRPELDDLVRWVVSDDRVSIQLVIGAGGSGKTRLARQLGEKAAALRCRSWWVPEGKETDAVQVSRDGNVPVILVMDYAETRTALPIVLEIAAGDQNGANLRILMLARSAGEWWQQLQDGASYRLGELLAGSEPLTLGPIADASNQRQVFAEAMAAFADLRGIPCPDAQLQLADQNAVVLVVHAVALLAVLDAEAATTISASTQQTTEDVLSRLLRHERRYWQQSLDRRLTAPLDPDVTERAVTAGCLIGAQDQESAIRLLNVIPDLADGQLRGAVARWLHDLYPILDGAAGEQELIGPLRPDLIAERLIVTVLDKHPELIPCLFAGLDQGRAARALTLLARAALTQPRATGQISRALEADPGQLVLPALTVTTATNPALAALIMDLLKSGVMAADRLEVLAQAIPYPSVALAEVGAAATATLAGAAITADERSRWLVPFSNWLSVLGRREEALAAIDEAVTIRRELAAARPDDYLPGLGIALNNQSNRLSDLGRRKEALAAIDEAVTIRRELAAARPDDYLPTLAGSLNNQSNQLSDLGRLAEALAAIDEAVTIRRKLAAARPDTFLSTLAGSLNNQSNRLSDLGRQEEALAAIDEAVTAYRKLAAARPDAFLPTLGIALNNQSLRLSDLGQQEEALAAIDEAVTAYRKLAAARPDAFLPTLGIALNNLASALRLLGLTEKANVAQADADHIANHAKL